MALMAAFFHPLHFEGPADHSESSEENALMFKQPQMKIQSPPTTLSSQSSPRLTHAFIQTQLYK